MKKIRIFAKTLLSLLLCLTILCCTVFAAETYASNRNGDDLLAADNLILPENTYPITEAALARMEEEKPAYELFQQIISDFPVDFSGEIKYPDSYGGAYYEDGCLYVNLVENADDYVTALYDYGYKSDIIRFNSVKYSFTDLYGLTEAIARLDIEEIIRLSVDMHSNQVNVVINSNLLVPGKEAQMYQDIRTKICADLNKEDFLWVNSWDTLPISFTCDTPSVALASNIIGGNRLYYDTVYNDYCTACISASYRGNPMIITAGHSVEPNQMYGYNDPEATYNCLGYHKQFANHQYGDWGSLLVGTDPSTGIPLLNATNKVLGSLGRTVAITDVATSGVNLVGLTVSKYGGRTGFSTGRITEIGVVETYDGVEVYGLIRVRLDNGGLVGRGDSGGPVYVGSTLLGNVSCCPISSISGISSDTYCFTPIYMVTRAGYEIKTN